MKPNILRTALELHARILKVGLGNEDLALTDLGQQDGRCNGAVGLMCGVDFMIIVLNTCVCRVFFACSVVPARSGSES